MTQRLADRAPADLDRRDLRQFAATLAREAEAGVRSAFDWAVLHCALEQTGGASAAAGRIA